MDTQEMISAAVRLLGGPSKVARARGLTAWAVSKWVTEGLPADKVIWLAEQTAWRFTPHNLAPHLYPHPDDGLPELLRGGRLRELDEVVAQQQSAGRGEHRGQLG